MKLKPVKMQVTVTKRPPRKIHLRITYQLESAQADVRPLLRAQNHYARLMAEEIEKGLWNNP